MKRKPLRGISYTKTALTASKLPRWRSHLAILLLTIAFASLIARAYWVQIANKGFYAEQGNKRVQRTIEVPAARGLIVDRNQRILAMSRRSVAVFADPSEIDNISKEQINALATLTKIPLAELSKKLERNTSFVYLARQLPYEIGEKITAMNIHGIYKQLEWQRVYPLGESASQVLGFAGSDNNGLEGIEFSMNQRLSAVNGQRMVMRNRLGQVVEDRGLLIAPQPGEKITLTIDHRIQHATHMHLRDAVIKNKAEAGSAIVLDAQNGEILALANWPAYNPNDRQRRQGSALRNRAVTDLFEPGSSIKPLNIALALDAGLITPTSQIDTFGGRLQLGGGYTVHDVSRNGRLSVADVMRKSSNVGMVQIMQRLSAKQMWESFRRFGLGQAPNIPFPGVASGWLRPANKWKPIEQATMSYGYGISVSLLQLAQAYTALAGTGKMQPVKLLKHQQTLPLYVISPKTAAAMRNLLESTAAIKSHINGYRVGGKSGTTRKLVNNKYESNRHLSTYIGMAPISNPKIIVAVTIDDPSNGDYYGSAVAAPVFADITKEALQILKTPPDKSITPERLISIEKRNTGVNHFN